MSGKTRHAGDCWIYRADYPYCNCGFHNDIRYRLATEDGFNINEAYPQHDELFEREHGWQREVPYPMPAPKPRTAEDIARDMKVLEDVFGPMVTGEE